MLELNGHSITLESRPGNAVVVLIDNDPLIHFDQKQKMAMSKNVLEKFEIKFLNYKYDPDWEKG